MIYQDLVSQNSGGIYTALLGKLLNSTMNLTNSFVTAQRLDARFEFENSSKECYFDDINKAVDVLLGKYYTKWSHLFLSFENGNLEPGATQTIVHNSTTNASSKNQVSAYDTTELVDDNGLTTEGKTNYNNSVYNLAGQQLIKTIYTNNVVYDTINSDIRHTLFSQIYNADAGESTNEN